MCTASLLQPQGEVTTGANRPTEDLISIQPKAVDVPLGIGLAGAARNSILTRRERLRIAEGDQ